MTAITSQPTPVGVLFGRHAIGIAVVALVNPAIWRSSDMLAVWIATWVLPVGLALALYGLYALFFTARAKAAWPKSFFVLAWVLLALSLLGNYQGPAPREAQQQASPYPGLKPFNGKLDGE